MNDAPVRSRLVAAGQRLLAEGLVARSWGNLSLRIDDRTMAITPSGIPWNDLTEDQIVMVDLETDAWTGPWKPSGERKVHREIYRRRPDVQAVVHTHQNAASVCAAARVPVALGSDTIACAPYALPGTKALTRGTVAALGVGPAVLMANHGVFTVGADLDQAFDRIRALEAACADLIAAQAPHPLPARADLAWNPAWVAALPGSDLRVSTAPYTAAWVALGRPLPALLDDLAQLAGRRVACAEAMPLSAPANGVLLVRHQGAVVAGADAEALAMVVEKAARAALGAEGLGGAQAFPAWEAELMRFVYKNAYSKQAVTARRG